MIDGSKVHKLVELRDILIAQLARCDPHAPPQVQVAPPWDRAFVAYAAPGLVSMYDTIRLRLAVVNSALSHVISPELEAAA